jgi:acetyl-CoA acetyltransferase family protein
MSSNGNGHAEELALVGGCRTPFAKAGTDLKSAGAADLATHVFREVLDRTGIDANEIDEVILGCAGPGAGEANPARVAGLRAGVPQHVPALTVMRNCASGMESVLAAEIRLRAGDGEVFLVGGAESMSNFPLIMGPKLTTFFQRLGKAKTIWHRLSTLLSFRPSFLKPRIAIIEGLTDPVSGLIMGNTAENVARLMGVSRSEQDHYALESHQRAAAARSSGRLAREIAPMARPPRFQDIVTQDNGIRHNQTLEALARLRPVFDRREGDVTVGNACQVTDGAAAMLVMSTARAKALGLEPLAIIRAHARSGLDPALMGLGPAYVIPMLLDDAGLSLGDVDLFEINEAFAAQVLGTLRALASDRFCRQELGRDGAVGEIDPEKVNVNGGAIALGHPIAASGARILLTLALELRERGRKYGIASLCIGGGQGQGFLLEIP